MKDANIVFVNYLSKDDVLPAVRSVIFDIKDSPYDVAITVSDNSENKDGVRDALKKEFPDVLYVDCGGNVGFGSGNTIGFSATPARYYFALNCDTVIPENSRVVERMIRFMDEHPSVGCIGPKLLNMDGSVQDSCYRFDFASMFVKPLRHILQKREYKWVKKITGRLLMKDFDHNKTQPVDWVLGAAMMVRNTTVEQVGWLDPRYFMYLEDADWCRMMWNQGWPVYYAHNIEIYHRYERGSSQIPGIIRALVKNKLTRIHIKSWAYFLWKWRKQFKRYAS